MAPVVLDADLPPALYPLAWLVGHWRGTGAVELPEGSALLAHPMQPESASGAESGDEHAQAAEPLVELSGRGRLIEQELTFTTLASGQLAYSAVISVLDAPPPKPPEITGGPQLGADIARDAVRRILHVETGYWRVIGPAGKPDGSVSDPDGLPGAHEIELLLAHPEGSVEVYVGRVEGPRIQLETDLVARTESGAAHTAATRLYGLVGGTLMWAMDHATDTTEMGSYLSGQLERV